MEIQLRLFMMFIRALVSIRCMKWTLILSAASLLGPKIAEQISRKIAGEHGPLRRTLGTLGESTPLPRPLRVRWINTACGDGINSPNISATIAETFFFLLLFFFVLFCFFLSCLCTSLQNGRDYTYCYSSISRYWRVHQRYWWLSQFTCFLYQHSGIL